MKGKPGAAAGAAPSPSPKSLVMVDGAGKMATLKLTTQTGLHFYDGTMLWVNPANSVTATAPRQGGGAAAGAAGSAGAKSTKALAIVDPVTGDELVVKKADPEPEQKQATPASTTSEATKSQATQGFPGITLGSAPSAGASLLPGISVGTPTFGGLNLSQFGGLSATPQILINPSSSTSIFAPQTSLGSSGITGTRKFPGEQTAVPSVLELLAKATKTTPSTLLALSQPLISTPHPTSGSKGGRGVDRDERNQGKAGKGGKSGGKAIGKGGPTDGKGKGRGGRGGAGYTNNKDKDLEQKPRKKFDQVRNDGDKYTKDAQYSASLDGRFWSLSCWPDSKRDETHGLTFGKHKLPVEGGVVKVVLFGGVNRYKIRLHLGKEGDEHVGESDRDGWSVAACEPSAANIALTEEAEKLGWKIYKAGEHPHLYPPGLELPEPSEESKTEDKEEVPATDKPVEEKSGEEKISEEKPAEKPAEEKPAEEKPAEEKPAEEKPAEKKPTEEKPAEEKPAEEKPAEEKPAEKPTAEATEEQPTEDKPIEKPSGEAQEG